MPISAENTMVEFLTKILRVITDAKVAMDADLPFLLELETKVLQKLREPYDAAQQNQQMNGDVPQAMGGMPPQSQGPMPMDPNMMPAPLAGQPAGRGASAGPGAPNADELRRLLNSGGA